MKIERREKGLRYVMNKAITFKKKEMRFEFSVSFAHKVKEIQPVFNQQLLKMQTSRKSPFNVPD